MFSKAKVLALALVLALVLPGAAFTQQTPDSKPKYSISIFTHEDWNRRPQDAKLVEMLTTNSKLVGLAKRCNFIHTTADSEIYRERWSRIYPKIELPLVVFQKPSGDVIYKASGSAIPQVGDELHRQMQLHYDALKEIVPSPPPQEWGEPDEEIPVEPIPDSVELFGGEPPIRTALGQGISLFTLVIGTAFLIVMMFVLILGLSVLKESK